MPEYRALLLLYSIPWPIKRAIALLLRFIYPRMARVLMALPVSNSELRLIYEEIGNYRELFTRRMQEAGLDALVCPPQVLQIAASRYAPGVACDASRWS